MAQRLLHYSRSHNWCSPAPSHQNLARQRRARFWWEGAEWGRTRRVSALTIRNWYGKQEVAHVEWIPKFQDRPSECEGIPLLLLVLLLVLLLLRVVRLRVRPRVRLGVGTAAQPALLQKPHFHRGKLDGESGWSYPGSDECKSCSPPTLETAGGRLV